MLENEAMMAVQFGRTLLDHKGGVEFKATNEVLEFEKDKGETHNVAINPLRTETQIEEAILVHSGFKTARLEQTAEALGWGSYSTRGLIDLQRQSRRFSTETINDASRKGMILIAFAQKSNDTL
jgi:hypothetical protein